MNEKYISGVGAGLILISFGIIVSFFVASGVENEATENNQTISFEQLGDFQNSLASRGAWDGLLWDPRSGPPAGGGGGGCAGYGERTHSKQLAFNWRKQRLSRH